MNDIIYDISIYTLYISLTRYKYNIKVYNIKYKYKS